MSDSIEFELAKCGQYAEEGYHLAITKYDEIKNVLHRAEEKLSKIHAEQNQVKRIRHTAV